MATGRLREVELDAIRITEKRFKDQEEERQYQISKEKADAGIQAPVNNEEPVEESVPKKGK